MRALFVSVTGVAGMGLVLIWLVHLTAVAGVPSLLGSAVWGLHIGVFLVGFPAVFVAQSLTRDAKRMEFWRVALRGCPPSGCGNDDMGSSGMRYLSAWMVSNEHLAFTGTDSACQLLSPE